MTKKQRYLLWFLIAVTSLFPLIFWYHTGKLIYVGDLNYPLNPWLYWSQKLTQTWNDTFPGGTSHSTAPSLLLYQAIPAVLGLLRISLPFAQILTYTLWLIVPSVTIAFFAQELRQRLAVGVVFTYAAVVLYQGNIYRMIMFGDAAHMVIWATFPLVIGLLMRAERLRSARWAVLAGLAMIMAAPAGPNPPMYVVFATALVVFCGYLWLTAKHKLEVGKHYLLAASVFLLTNAFWLLPFLKGQLSVVQGGGLGDNNLASWVDSVSGTSSWYNILRLQGAWDWFAGFNNQPYVPYALSYQTHPFLVGWALAFPIVAVLALVLRPRLWRFTLPVFGLGIAGFALAMGTHEPMTQAFRWLMAHVPFFWMFRSPWYKFGFWQALAMVLLASITIDTAYTWLHRHWPRLQPVLAVIGALFVIATGVSVYPFVTGKKFPQTTAYLSIPDYVATNSAALQTNTPDELALLPNVPAFNYRWHWSGLIDPLFYTTTQQLLYTAAQIGTDATTLTRGSLYDALLDRLVAVDGAASARTILNWVGPQAFVNRDDIDTTYYSATAPLFTVPAALNRIGLTEQRGALQSPWHLYPTGLPARPLRLSRDVLFTTESPKAILPALAELNQLTPETSFINDEATAATIRSAGVPVRTLVAVDLDKPLELGAQTRIDYRAQPGHYEFFIKQLAPPTEMPNLSQGAEPFRWTALGNGWWKSEIRTDVGSFNHVEVSNPRRNEEHARSFAGNGNWRMEDVVPNGPGTAHFFNRLIPNEPNGIDLATDAHKLMNKTELINMQSGRLYELSFDYQTDPGAPGEFSLHLTGVEHTALNEGLPATSDWTTVKRVFRVEPGTTHTYLNLFSFSPEVGKVAHQRYRNPSVTEISPIQQLLIEEVSSSTATTNSDSIEVNRRRPTELAATLPDRATPALLTFDQSFDPNWQLRGKLATVPHVKANWYANAWVIPAGSVQPLAVHFALQDWLWVGIFISLLSVTSALVLVNRHK